jgi:mono/diheme cytochrome c family protein
MRILNTLVLGAALSVAQAQAEENLLNKGRQLVEINCSGCHATGREGKSPFAPAPPFREVARNYTQDELVDGFMEGLAVRHKAMPDWDMTMDQAEAVATYILSIKSEDVTEGEGLIIQGHTILRENCARCHAIDPVGPSPLANAPPFREVMKRYEPQNLEEALAEGIVTGHNQMPVFTLEPDQIVAITAYLSTLRPEHR